MGTTGGTLVISQLVPFARSAGHSAAVANYVVCCCSRGVLSAFALSLLAMLMLFTARGHVPSRSSTANATRR